LVLGAGGAARAAVFAMARSRAKKIWIYNRTLERAQGLMDYATTYFPETEIDLPLAADDLKHEKIDLVINATACGLQPTDGSAFDLRKLGSKPAVYDLIYSPAETALLKQARELGLAAVNGLGMLAAQAALSFELWTGEKDGVRQAMMETLKKWR